VPVWSLAHIAGMHLKEFAAVQGQAHDPEIMDDTFARPAMLLIASLRGRAPPTMRLRPA